MATIDIKDAAVVKFDFESYRRVLENWSCNDLYQFRRLLDYIIKQKIGEEFDGVSGNLD